MTKILFVCLGNICRSPMAEGIFRDKAETLGLTIEFDSCGTGSWHVGESPDKRAQSCMVDMGSDISDLRARQFSVEDFKRFDRIYVMDESNLNDVLALAETDEDRGKVEMVLNSIYPGKDASVPDPYFGGDRGFVQVFDMLSASAEKILGEISNEAR